MRNLGLLSASVAAVAILAGCGGGGGGSSKQVTRTVAGFVYVLGGTGSANPNAVILPTATAPAGFFAPTSGNVTLSVPDGTISRAPDSENFDMSLSNAVICSVKAKENTLISVGGSGLNFEGNGRSFSPFSTSIGVKADSNTVLTLNTGSSVYTPGPAASLFYTINGIVPTNPTQAFIAGDVASQLAVVSLDASGVIVPTAVYNVAASNAGVGVAGSGTSGPFSLTPAGMAQAEATVDVTIDDTTANLQATINGNFTHGTPSSVTVVPAGSSVLWGTVAPAVANTTTGITATVLNQFAVPMPGVTITLTTNKISGGANTWSTTDGTLAGNAFATQSAASDVNGQLITTFSPPTAMNAILTGTQTNPKGLNTITGTAGTATGTGSVTILRPIGSLTIAGDLTLDTGNTGIQYDITGALDVDGASATTPAGGVTWTLTNTPSGGNIGNTGDGSPASVSTAATNGSTTGSVLVGAGSTAGQFTLQAAIGAVNSNTLTVEIYGVPSKIAYNPNTVVSAISGASGEYATGGTGNTINVTFTFLDSFGHTVGAGGAGGNATWTYTGNIDSATGGSLNPGSGSNVSAFAIVTGPGDGLFTVTTQGNWTGANGGSGNFNLQRNAGHNAP